MSESRGSKGPGGPTLPNLSKLKTGSWVDEAPDENQYELPLIHFGRGTDEDEDMPEVDSTDDDALLEETDPDVVDILGFDPLDFEEDDDEEDEVP